MKSYFKSNHSEYIETHDDIFGNDIISIILPQFTYHGYLTKSPLEERLMSELNYLPVADETKKPFKANWMVFDSELLLLYVNGVFNEKHLHTYDLVPDCPDTDLFHFTDYNGSLTLIVCIIQLEDEYIDTTNFESINADILHIKFEKGMLVNIEKEMNI